MAPLYAKQMAGVAVLGLLISSLAYGHAVSMLFGTIEFPKSIKTAPQYEIFYEGQKIKPEIDSNKILFNIPINRMLNRFFILFVEDPSYVLKQSEGAFQQNTIDYLKSGTVYRIFELQLQGTAWRYVERLLAADLAIPDNTIIIYLPPHYIDKLVGGKGLQLPHIMIKENIIELLSGSLEALQKKADELSMAAIDMSTFHVPAQEAIRVAGNRRIIVPTV
jgi:hypothetical protein